MTRLSRALDAGIEIGVVALLLFAPLPYGGVRPWAQAAIEAGVAVVAALWLVRMLAAGEFTVRRHPAFWPGCLMAAVVMLQALVPGRSVSPYATGESARLYLAYFVLLVVLSGYLSTRARILRLTWTLVALGAAAAVLGLMNFALGAQPLLWLPKSLTHDRLTTTFLNPNHQALYFSMSLFLALGLLLRPSRRGDSDTRMAGRGSRRLGASVVLVGLIFVLGMALALTMSRGAIVSTLGGLVILLVLVAAGRARGRLPFLIVGGLVATTAYAAWVGLESTAARLISVARDPVVELRWPIWEATLRMAMETPLLGVGLGGFQDAFTRVRPTAVAFDKLIDFAHNDYLQLFAEAGVVGLGLLVWALVAFGMFVVRRLRQRRDPFVKGLTIGGTCALVVAALHSLVDFGLHRPGNALVVVAVAALTPAIVTWRVHRTGESVELEQWRWSLAGRTGAWATGVVAAGLVVVATFWLVPPGVADWKLQSALARAGRAERVRGTVGMRELAEARRDMEQAVAWDPRNPRAQAALAEVLDETAARMWIAGIDAEGRRLPDASAQTRLRATQGLVARAYVAYRQSLEHRPVDPVAHQGFGWLLGRLHGVRRAARGLSDGALDAPLADLFRSDDDLIARGLGEVTLGTQIDPNNVPRFLSLARYALAFPVDEKTSRRIAAEAFRRVLTIDPWYLGRVVDELFSRNADQEFVFDSVPRNRTLRRELAQHFEQRERWRAAWRAYEEAIELSAHPAQEAEARIAYGRALLRRSDRERALSQARQALVAAPEDPDVFVLLGEVYEDLGKVTEAEAAFTSAIARVGPDAPQRANAYRRQLAGFFARHGQGDRAIALWRQVLKATPNDPWLRLDLGRTMVAGGDGSGALVEFQTASSMASSDAYLQWEVARALARAGHVREAVATYEASIALRPRDWDLRLELAELFARAGWPDRAAEQYRRILSGRPEHEGARRGLANLDGGGRG